MSESPDINSTGASDQRQLHTMNEAGLFIRGNRIAAVLGVDKKTVHSRAMRETWPMQRQGNRWEYLPPEEVAALLAPATVLEAEGEAAPTVKFTDLPADSNGRKTALRRQEAVLLLEQFLQFGKN